MLDFNVRVRAFNPETHELLIETAEAHAVYGIDRYLHDGAEIPREIWAAATHAEFTMGGRVLTIPLASNVGHLLPIGTA